VRIHLVIRAGCAEFVWEPGPGERIFHQDRIFYEQPHVWNEERRQRCCPPPPLFTANLGSAGANASAVAAEEAARRLFEFEQFVTGGRADQVCEEDFEFVEMTARAESGAAEGVPAFLEHSVTGDVDRALALFSREGEERGWTRRPKALNLGPLFRTRLTGYRRQRTREIVWVPGPGLYWERGDRPLRLLRMAQEPVRAVFCREEEPFGFHLLDLRTAGGGGGGGGSAGLGAGGTEVAEVVEGSPADARGVVVGRTIKRLSWDGGSEDVRQWTKAQVEEALRRMPARFTIEFGKGDTEERRHAPLGDCEMAILMDERFMRGFLHELWQAGDDAAAAAGEVPRRHWSTARVGRRCFQGWR